MHHRKPPQAGGLALGVVHLGMINARNEFDAGGQLADCVLQIAETADGHGLRWPSGAPCPGRRDVLVVMSGDRQPETNVLVAFGRSPVTTIIAPSPAHLGSSLPILRVVADVITCDGLELPRFQSWSDALDCLPPPVLRLVAEQGGPDVAL